MRPMITFWFDPVDGGVELRQFSTTYQRAHPSVQVAAFQNLRHLLEEMHQEALRVEASLRMLAETMRDAHGEKGVH